MFATKLTYKIPNPYHAKKHYHSFIRKKNTKSVKKSKIITHQPKSFENLIIVDIKSVITEHQKTSQKLSKTIRQAEKVGSNSSLYSDTKTSENFLTEKSVKLTKQEPVFKGFGSSYMLKFYSLLNLNYNLKILNMQLKIN